jgi:ubiquinone/menaquinone biosynthesis C-methylase UbiE
MRVVLALLLWAASAAAQRGPSDEEIAKFLELAPLREGQTVAEIGAGEGKLAMAAARAVGSAGRVYANELDEKRIAGMKAALAKAKLDNVILLRGAEDSTNLPADCCDVVFMRRVYHHFTRAEAMNRDLLRAVRPGGQLIVIDMAPPGDHAIEPAKIVAEVTAAGFTHERTIQPWVGRNFWVGLRKP